MQIVEIGYSAADALIASETDDKDTRHLFVIWNAISSTVCSMSWKFWEMAKQNVGD